MGIAFFEKLIFWFMIYSIGGWIYETILCSVTAKRFVNRGFLNGPFCPIYGCGALLDVLILGKIENVFILFIAGVLVTCSLEYLTSYVMEKLFHARWWDYSDRKCNIAGRVCLLGAVVFGLFSVVLIKFLHPAVIRLTLAVPKPLLHILVILLSVSFLVDLFITISGFSGFNTRLEAFAEALNEARNETAAKIRASIPLTTLNTLYEGFAQKLNRQQRRMLAAFPKLHSVRHEHLIAEIRERILKKKARSKKNGRDSEK